ncbi:PEGA domain-containing protein [Hyalangium rubrum]|uniref:PEGA domain-containing protein n=1 Tax=Hyalangium rubrum TaxID=3103134 RepID=A0ABU5H2G0_9BACT|nr:PEGA domain-containing protein [Hyalangium sp. s54d21]MDY7227304.1 PEGA domain-containing protein [Hyalangium sp. s54d21]
MRYGQLWVALVAVLGVTNTGCGIIGWGISGKSELQSYTLSRTQEVEVSSIPMGATIYVDGAEAGVTPKSILAPVTQVRHIRQQSVVPGLIGLGLDILGLGAGTAACLEADSSGCLVASTGIGVGIILVGTYLVFGRSTSEDTLDVMPTVIDITLNHPDFQEQTRRIRVPDLTEVEFKLKPVPTQQPTSPDAPTLGP